MRKSLAIVIAVVFTLSAAPAFADLFALDVDAPASYLQMDNIGLPEMDATGTIAGFGVGVRGRLQILFLNAIVAYHHLFNSAEILHLGLGVGYRTDLLPVIDLYVQGASGLLMTAAKGSALVDDDVTGEGGPEAGVQGRAGGGIEIPFAGDWLAIGVGADLGVHHITGDWGYDFSVNVHFGLRI